MRVELLATRLQADYQHYCALTATYVPATPEEEAHFRQHWQRFQQQLAQQRQRQAAHQRFAA